MMAVFLSSGKNARLLDINATDWKKKEVKS